MGGFCSGLAAANASAATSRKTIAVRATRAEARCDALLGGAAQRQRNRERREQRLYWIDDSDGSITIAHATDSWSDPATMRLRGVQLERVVGTGAQRRAIVRLDVTGARRVGCKAGRYVVDVDDSLGSLRVLALLADGLLVERGNQLAYVGRLGSAEPSFLLAWGSRYRVLVSASSANAPTISLSRYRSPWRRRVSLGGSRIVYNR